MKTRRTAVARVANPESESRGSRFRLSPEVGRASATLAALALLLAFDAGALAATLCVDVNSANPTPPYTNWATAARVIQDAVDAAAAGDQILVTNGVYATGGRVVYGSLTNRVAVTKAVQLLSVNGPRLTVIQGYQVPGTTNGDGAIRCVYLTNGASLVGCTLMYGATRDNSANADYYTEQSGGGVWCETTNSVISNCVLTANSARGAGGGAYQGTLNNCTLSGNSASAGGGAYMSTLSDCALITNSAGWAGGGAYGSALNNCALSGNSAQLGGGASGFQLCSGGGGLQGIHCWWNPVTLNNCTLTGNSASKGGGTFECALINSITYFNTAQFGANYYYDINVPATGTMSYCCTTPLPTSGVGNISADPRLTDSAHLSAGSPCVAAGSAAFATGVDIDGQPWANPPSIGCDEFHTGASGPLQVVLNADYTNVAADFTVDFSATILGHAASNRWDFGDGMISNNTLGDAHAWTQPGDYVVSLSAYNETYPVGVSASVAIHVVPQPIHYVSLSSTNPASPYDSWATAATNIQDAVDAATVVGALVLVTNGTYATGGAGNRVTVDRTLMVRSVNGPQVTIISGTRNGPVTSRCICLTNGASLSGFTLTNGYADNGGGVWCASETAVVSNCVLVANYAGDGGGAYQGTLINCTLNENWVGNAGGGVALATLKGCTVSSNVSEFVGAGAYGSSLSYCELRGNSVDPSSGISGGGAAQSSLDHCTLVGNFAYEGGGVYGGRDYAGGASTSTLNHCTLTGNFAQQGGGAYSCLLNNCALTGNSATNDDYGDIGTGGGVFGGILNNCTLTGNSANMGGGAAGEDQYGNPCALNNCIVYFNTAENADNYDANCVLSYCCASPPAPGVGNIGVDPKLASASHLSVLSPCRGAGSSAFATGTDIDGEPWANPPSIGCDEFYMMGQIGPLTVAIAADFTNAAIGFEVNFGALINGNVSTSVWDFGDGTVVSNQPYASHAWQAAGQYQVVLRAYNQTYPSGVSATATVGVVAPPVHYVAVGNNNPVAPYSSWATAASSLQDAVDVATVPGAVVLVTNGTYATGGRTVGTGLLMNRVVVDKPLTIQSVNGPGSTIIQGLGYPANGSNSVRCVYLTNAASLIGFTLTNGGTLGLDYSFIDQNAGGVWCASSMATVSNCVIAGNSAYSDGGGAWSGTLNNCILTGNSAGQGGGAACSVLNNCKLQTNSVVWAGGGAYGSALNNCALSGNSAELGGGAYDSSLSNCTLTGNSALVGGGAGGDSSGGLCTLNNCIVSFNSAQSGGNYDTNCFLNHCCTTPMPTNGSCNITNAPLFVDYASGNLRLQSNSPCINAGNNAHAPAGPDLDGNPRIAGGTVDIGAYEFQNPSSVISYAWLQQYGLPTDGSVDYADPDGDSMNNWQEWRAGTDPNNALSALRMVSAVPTGTNVTVTWQSVVGVNYFLERSTNLAAPTSFAPVTTAIRGQPGTTAYTDTSTVGPGPFFYRVGVQ